MAVSQQQLASSSGRIIRTAERNGRQERSQNSQNSTVGIAVGTVRIVVVVAAAVIERLITERLVAVYQWWLVGTAAAGQSKRQSMAVGRATVEQLKHYQAQNRLVGIVIQQISRRYRSGTVRQNSRDRTVSRDSRDKIAGWNSGSSSSGGRAVNQDSRGFGLIQSFSQLFDIKTLHLALRLAVHLAVHQQLYIAYSASASMCVPVCLL